MPHRTTVALASFNREPAATAPRRTAVAVGSFNREPTATAPALTVAVSSSNREPAATAPDPSASARLRPAHSPLRPGPIAALTVAIGSGLNEPSTTSPVAGYHRGTLNQQKNGSRPEGDGFRDESNLALVPGGRRGRPGGQAVVRFTHAPQPVRFTHPTCCALRPGPIAALTVAIGSGLNEPSTTSPAAGYHRGTLNQQKNGSRPEGDGFRDESNLALVPGGRRGRPGGQAVVRFTHAPPVRFTHPTCCAPAQAQSPPSPSPLAPG